MADFFVDTSALIKRYIEEDGSEWLSNLCGDRNNVVMIAAVTRVELLAAITRRGKGGTMSPADSATACAEFYSDLNQYVALDVNTALLDRAAQLAEKHALRGYDAIQLAAAIEANFTLFVAGLPPITLISSDREMNAAAVLEGLSVDDPANHR